MTPDLVATFLSALWNMALAIMVQKSSDMQHETRWRRENDDLVGREITDTQR
jgi:hypothetical protein